MFKFEVDERSTWPGPLGWLANVLTAAFNGVVPVLIFLFVAALAVQIVLDFISGRPSGPNPPSILPW